MKFYYFNNSADVHGRHEVHTEDCSYIPSSENRTMIGYMSNCSDAIDRAKREHPSKSFDGCYWCSRECNKG